MTRPLRIDEILDGRGCVHHPDRPAQWLVPGGMWVCDPCRGAIPIPGNPVMSLPPADRRCYGLLVNDAINQLWGSSEAAAPDDLDVGDERWDDYQGCCPRCCGPCSVVKELLDEGQLDYLVQAWPGYQGSAWWDVQHQQVNRVWLYASWANADQLGCHGQDDQ